jgi:uncharacterized DUF497 family protein
MEFTASEEERPPAPGEAAAQAVTVEGRPEDRTAPRLQDETPAERLRLVVGHTKQDNALPLISMRRAIRREEQTCFSATPE